MQADSLGVCDNGDSSTFDDFKASVVAIVQDIENGSWDRASIEAADEGMTTLYYAQDEGPYKSVLRDAVILIRGALQNLRKASL